jgi:hypothetical protein
MARERSKTQTGHLVSTRMNMSKKHTKKATNINIEC